MYKNGEDIYGRKVVQDVIFTNLYDYQKRSEGEIVMRLFEICHKRNEIFFDLHFYHLVCIGVGRCLFELQYVP